MDTQLTYIFPQNYNAITIIKEPQDVRFSPLMTGGILFEREILRFDTPKFGGDGGVLAGNFGRFDANAYLKAGTPLGGSQIIFSHYQSGNYKDGKDQIVYSQYNRSSLSAIGTITPNPKTALELSLDLGRGEAAYADRAMDARTFDRLSFGGRYHQVFQNGILDLRGYYHGNDHING